MRKTKLESAAGPDNIKKIHLKKAGTLHILAKLYNALLAAEYYPNKWKINRTTLIPKKGKDNNNVKNWRPITIGS
ncbi:r2 protein [Lasius niger]|uniref:R2 protein n=1 Tax=Lasius niger TaxID=67767 RepID=A0A0J7KQ73_LASNI|nr:r2 protein [Lasius niger]